MKKILYILMFCTLLAFSSGEVFALDMGVGIQTWYCWWEPAWDNDDLIDWDVDSGLLAGPMVLFRVTDRLSLSSVLMLGMYDASSIPNAGETWTRDILKYDMDTTLSYSLNNTFKIFGGLKIQGYTFDEKHVTTAGTYTGDYYFNGAGPGAGLSATFTLTDNLFASLTGSVIGLYNYYRENKPDGSGFSSAVYSYGFSGTAALMYYFTGIDTLVTAGFRYQQIHLRQDKSEDASFNYDGGIDRFYGFSLSALYMLNL